MKKAIVGSVVRFTFDGAEPLEFDATKAGAANRAYAEMHGWMARLGDAAALSRKDPKTGVVTTITELARRAEIAALIDHYYNPASEWNMKVKAQAPNPFFLKLAESRGCTYAEAQTWYQEKLIADMQKLIDGEM